MRYKVASTNKTSNLALNQWVLTDPFNMADFNADNAAIDAAVGANPLVKLMDVTLATAANAVELALSGLDLSKYAQLQLYYRNTGISWLYLRLNNSSGSYSYFDYLGNTQSAGTSCYIPRGNSADIQLCMDNVYVVPACPSGKFAIKPDTAILPSALQTINLIKDVSSATNLFPVGSRFVLMGVKL